MTSITPDDAYLTPASQIKYGDVVNVNGKCYIKTGRKTGTMTSHVSNETYSYVGEIVDGVCICDFDDQRPGDNEDSALNSDNYIYVSPSDDIPEGAVFRYGDKCYVKTGAKGTMSTFIPTPSEVSDTCEDCEASGS